MGDHDEMRLLLVEDNPIDARATLRAFKSLSRPISVTVVEDGDQALAVLADAGEPKPDLVLLDLNLPGRDGLDVLRHAKQSAELRRIPIVVFSTSTNEADVMAAYDLGANAFVHKPIDLAGWADAMERIDSFWLSLVRLAPR